MNDLPKDFINVVNLIQEARENSIRKVNEELGITMICNLHFLSLVRQYATRVIALKGGEIVFEGSPDKIDEAWFEKIYGQGAKEVHVN